MNRHIPLGKRLTCPYCKDSAWFSFEQIKAAGGHIECANHPSAVIMIDLVDLYLLLGRGEPLSEEEVSSWDSAVDNLLVHPEDFEHEEEPFFEVEVQ